MAELLAAELRALDAILRLAELKTDHAASSSAGVQARIEQERAYQALIAAQPKVQRPQEEPE